MRTGRAAARLLPVLVLLALCLTALPAEAAPRQLLLGFGELKYSSTNPVIRQDALDKTVAINGNVARINVGWGLIAPDEKTPSFDPTDPADPHYDWARLDAAVRDADARGLQIMFMVQRAPAWAEGKHKPPDVLPGIWKPNPRELGYFAKALARRYSGDFGGLPRVRWFECWGEVNLKLRLAPIWGGKNGKKPVVVDHYRKMLNAFYDSVHGVDPTNQVVTAALSPYGANPGLVNLRPLQFWRKLLCVKDNKRLSPKRPCKKAKFDVLAHNPISHSKPSISALSPDDISTPDLHNLVEVLRAAERAGSVGTRGRHPVWATEIYWESSPPDPFWENPSLKKQAAWYTEAIHSLWRQGASMVLILQVLDLPYHGVPGRDSDNLQTGVYLVDGTPKPAAQAVSFPFLAQRAGRGRVSLWGKAPASGDLVVTRRGEDRPIARFDVEGGAVFTRKVRRPKGGGKLKLRAEVGGEQSLYWTVK